MQTFRSVKSKKKPKTGEMKGSDSDNIALEISSVNADSQLSDIIKPVTVRATALWKLDALSLLHSVLVQHSDSCIDRKREKWKHGWINNDSELLEWFC